MRKDQDKEKKVQDQQDMTDENKEKPSEGDVEGEHLQENHPGKSEEDNTEAAPKDECKAEAEEEMEDRSDLQQRLQELANNNQKLKEENDAYYQQLARLKADFDNYKKRMMREGERQALEKAEKLTGDLLPVLDNFERALTNFDPDRVDAQYLEGVQMIYEQFKKVLENHGLEKIEAVGQTFDPNYHQAIMQVESDEHDKNVVVEELQPGFLFQGKLLRASVVKVSK